MSEQQDWHVAAQLLHQRDKIYEMVKDHYEPDLHPFFDCEGLGELLNRAHAASTYARCKGNTISAVLEAAFNLGVLKTASRVSWFADVCYGWKPADKTGPQVWPGIPVSVLEGLKGEAPETPNEFKL